MKYFKTLFIPSAGLVLLFVLLALNSCKNLSKLTGKTESDSVKTFTKLIDHPEYLRNLTRIEYKGKLAYDRYCQICHGADGDGKGFNSYNLESSFSVKPFDFTDSLAVVKLSNEEIEKVISQGGRSIGKSQYMPPWGGVLNGDDIQNVMAYVRTFSKMKQ